MHTRGKQPSPPLHNSYSWVRSWHATSDPRPCHGEWLCCAFAGVTLTAVFDSHLVVGAVWCVLVWIFCRLESLVWLGGFCNTFSFGLSCNSDSDEVFSTPTSLNKCGHSFRTLYLNTACNACCVSDSVDCLAGQSVRWTENSKIFETNILNVSTKVQKQL